MRQSATTKLSLRNEFKRMQVEKRDTGFLVQVELQDGRRLDIDAVTPEVGAANILKRLQQTDLTKEKKRTKRFL